MATNRVSVKNIRTVSLDFWTDEKVVELSPLARLLFMGSWHYACDTGGHLDATPRELRMKVLPNDVGADGAALVDEIVEAGLMTRDDEGRLTIPGLPEHQRTDKRYRTSCARCPVDHAQGSEQTSGDHESARGDHAGTTRDPKGTRAGGGGGGGGGVTPSGGARKRASATKGTRIPEIFPITPEMAEWGRAKAPDVDAPREHEKFCDYWRSVSGARGVKRDWIATWRVWMTKAQEDAERRNGHSPTSKAGSDLPEWMLA